MKTTKKLLNDLVKRVAELSNMPNNKAQAVELGKESYIWLNEGYGNYYSIAEIFVANGTQHVPFMLSHHAYKAAEMAAMLRGLIAGLAATK